MFLLILFYKRGSRIFTQGGKDLMLSRLFYVINNNHNLKDSFYADIGVPPSLLLFKYYIFVYIRNDKS